MKEINVIISSLGGGGAEQVCVTLCNEWTKATKVNLYVLNLKNANYLDRLSENVVLHDLNIGRARELFFIQKKILNSADSLIIFKSELLIPIVMMKKTYRSKTKLVYRSINTFSSSFPTKNLKRKIYKYFIEKCDLVINQSENMYKDYEKCGFDILKHRVINNPINERYTQFDLRDHKVNEEREYLLFMGRLEKQKNIFELLAIMKKAKERNPNILLKIVGKGSLENELKEYVVQNDLENNVAFLEFSNNPMQLYLDAKVTVLTSIYEGFPNVLVESIALGTPVISYDCPSGPNEIIDEKNGILVKYRDIDGFVRAINAMLDGNYDKMKVKETSNKFSSFVIANEYTKYFDKMINKSNK